MARKKMNDLRRRVYLALEQGATGDHISILVDRLLVLLILINLVAIALESVPALGTRYAIGFSIIDATG